MDEPTLPERLRALAASELTVRPEHEDALRAAAAELERLSRPSTAEEAGERADAIPAEAVEAALATFHPRGWSSRSRRESIAAALIAAAPFLRAAQSEAGNGEAERRVGEATRYLRAVLTGHEHDLRRGELADVEAALAALDPASRAMEVPVRAAHPEAGSEETERLREALRQIAKEANEGGVFHEGICADSAHRCAYVVQMAHAALRAAHPEADRAPEAEDHPFNSARCDEVARKFYGDSGADRAPGEVETVARDATWAHANKKGRSLAASEVSAVKAGVAFALDAVRGRSREVEAVARRVVAYYRPGERPAQPGAFAFAGPALAVWRVLAVEPVEPAEGEELAVHREIDGTERLPIVLVLEPVDAHDVPVATRLVETLPLPVHEIAPEAADAGTVQP